MKRRWIRFSIALLLFALVIVFVFPCNEIDNRLPFKRAEMSRITREWGRLAPFPDDAQGFTIWTEGNAFTRTFRGSFTSSPAEVDLWLKSSAGVQEGESRLLPDGSHEHILKMGGGASYGTVRVSPDGSRVEFRVSWS
jgi:hypothetical protein